MILKLIKRVAREARESGRGYLIDGFPRTAVQAKAIVEAARGKEVVVTLTFKLNSVSQP